MDFVSLSPRPCTNGKDPRKHKYQMIPEIKYLAISVQRSDRTMHPPSIAAAILVIPTSLWRTKRMMTKTPVVTDDISIIQLVDIRLTSIGGQLVPGVAPLKSGRPGCFRNLDILLHKK